MGGVIREQDDAFLTERFRLFEKYTIPSIQNQTNQNFVWCVLFSGTTPQKFRKKIEGYTKSISNFVPLYIDDAVEQPYRQVIADFLDQKEKEWIITTRCDNDDLLDRDFIEEIQKNAEPGEEMVLAYPEGYQYEEKSKILRKYHFPTNHFTTLVSNSGKIIYDIKHMEVYESYKVENISTRPMWVEVIHGGNVYNCMGGFKYSEYVKEYSLAENFGVDLKGEFSSLNLFAHYVSFAFKKLFTKKDRIIAFIKRKSKR